MDVKKMLAVGAAVIGTVAMADVVSSSVVGYTGKDSEKGKFIILGAQFEQVTGGTKIDGLISGISGVDLDDDGAFLLTAPQIQIPVSGGYITRYYLNDGWYDKGNDDWIQKAGWCDSDGLIATDEYTQGVAMWFKSVGEDANVVVAGAVPDSDQVSVDCPATFALRANAYPIALTLNSEKMAVSGIAGVDLDDDGAFLLTAPQIQIPVTGGYITRYYLNDGWYDKGNDDWIQKAGWCDSDGLIVSDEIPVAQGFWTKGVGSSFTMTFNK